MIFEAKFRSNNLVKKKFFLENNQQIDQSFIDVIAYGDNVFCIL